MWFNLMFNTTNASKIFITSKTQTTQKAIANGYTNTQKIDLAR